MNKVQLFKEIGSVDDDLITEAEAAGRKMSFRKSWVKWGAVAACMALIFAVSFHMLRDTDSDFDMLRSDSGIKVSYVEKIENLTETGNDLVYLTEQELFTAWNTDIFRGEIVSIRNIEIDSGSVWKEYRAIVKIRVEKVFRGTAVVGDTISILLNSPIDMNIWVEDNDVVEKMRVGQTGIFMPLKYDENSIYSTNNKQIDLRDLAEYGFLDGVRYAFLEADNGLQFAKWAYESISSATTLDEIERYIVEMIK